MLRATIDAVSRAMGVEVGRSEEAISCHHNYVARENHFSVKG